MGLIARGGMGDQPRHGNTMDRAYRWQSIPHDWADAQKLVARSSFRGDAKDT